MNGSNCMTKNEACIFKSLNEYQKKFLWNFSRISEEHALPYSIKNNVKIGILDSGVDIHHPLLNNNNIYNIHSYVNEYCNDDVGHGTQIAGIFEIFLSNVNLFSFKVFNHNKYNSIDIIKGIIDATDKNVDILNISLGCYKNKLKDKKIITKFYQAIEYAKSKNVIIIASSGNGSLNMDESDLIHLPSDHPYVISVGSSNKDGDLSSYTNYGENLNLVAPTGEIKGDGFSKLYTDELSLTLTSSTNFFTPFNKIEGLPTGMSFTFGTSIATPQVSALFAKEIDLHTEQSPIDIINTIYKRAITCKSKNEIVFKEIRW